MPDETLCMAAMRSSARVVRLDCDREVFDDILLTDNYNALRRYQEGAAGQQAARRGQTVRPGLRVIVAPGSLPLVGGTMHP
jgi:hypothetical protein